MPLWPRTGEVTRRKSLVLARVQEPLITDIPRFGVISFLLEMIPFANLVFAFTNTVGAALWAADLEKSSTTAPKLQEQARKAQ